jgi:anti-sigma B factor antagonist
MEIIKQPISDGIVKVNIGTEYDEEKKEVAGPVELDIENQAHFVEIINSIFDEGNVYVIIDMNNISYIDSSGLWALFEGHKKATQRNGKLVLLNPTRDVKRVLDITKMSSKMKVFEDEAQALDFLKTDS